MGPPFGARLSLRSHGAPDGAFSAGFSHLGLRVIVVSFVVVRSSPVVPHYPAPLPTSHLPHQALDANPSYLVMLQEYAKLPKTPPGNCYICTAAARGHRRLVRSEERLLPGGTVRRVNDQTRYFKAAELLLAAVSPGGHRLCRRIYDCLGPRLAALLIHPVVADVAYLSLKPLEWAVRAGLALLLPECHASIKRLYRC